ncbi:PIR Superfamily Protein [Plasmodium ovale curtisi]|uniref:PIR Superfamily Protein n=1 Tax=Plasmodium ovale curtisi TaxID=864141 RepID=A0A1A8WJ86_PLAOA|nr:PIR Superfamily Protein [Plasmodium ovale curtisi]
MTCYKNPGKESYGFFEDFNYYNGHAVNADGKNFVVIKDIPEFPEEYICTEYGDKSCYYFLINSVFPSIENPHIICEKFKYIYNLLSNSMRGVKQGGTLGNNDWAFLNYWLNEKLRDTNTEPSICVKDFYEKLREMDENYFKIRSTEDKLFNMKKDEFENMKKLFELYNIKNKVSETMVEGIPEEKSALCSVYTEEFNKKYRDAIINCRDGCSIFFNILTDFKNKYRDEFSFYSKTSIFCKYKELFELPDYETVLKEHKRGTFKMIITVPVLFPLLGMFFTFIFSDMVKYNKYFNLTHFRQKAFEKIKSTKNILLGARERSNELLSYTSDNDNIIGNHEEYSIRYYSIGNY